MRRFIRAITHKIGNRFVALGLLAGALTLTAAPSASAAQLRLIELTCQKPQENDANGDELRLDIRSDSGETISLRQNNMKKLSRWGIDRTISFHKSVQAQLTEIDTYKDGIYFRDENLGKVGITNKTVTGRDGTLPAIQYATFKGEGAHYVLSYQVIATMPREVELVSLRCIVTQEKDSDGDELRLHFQADGGKDNTIPRNGIKAGQTWAIGRKVQFFNQVRVRLVENDGFGIHFRDEDLGTRILKTPSIGVATVEFTGHGARYVLTYRMSLK